MRIGQSTFQLDLKGLQNIQRHMMQADKLVVAVGILPETNGRDDGETNASVGAKQEFGAAPGEVSFTTAAQMAARGRGFMSWLAGWPARSFLRMPLMTRLPGQVQAQGGQFWKTLVEGGGIPQALEFLGFLGQAVIAEAFQTRGFGRWPANSRRTILWKKSGEPLIDSRQLEQSITSRVIAKGSNP